MVNLLELEIFLVFRGNEEYPSGLNDCFRVTITFQKYKCSSFGHDGHSAIRC